MGGHQDPRLPGKHPELKSKVITPDVLVQPHMASLQMTFYSASGSFPASYYGDAFVAEHGSWNRSQPVGYRVVFVPFRDGAPAGDLYLEISFRPHPRFRVDGRDVYLDLPVAPWEAALGATVEAPLPDGSVQLTVPAGSTQGRKLRLKGKGIPGKTPGDLYVVLQIAMPPAANDAQRQAWQALARAHAGFEPRADLGGT